MQYTVSIDLLLNGLKSLDELEKRIKSFQAVQKTFGGSSGGGAAPNINRAQDAAIRLAQATARLKSAQGDLSGAVNILSKALEGNKNQTLALVSAQQQLFNLQQKLSRQTSGGDLIKFLSSPQIREAGESIQQAGQAFERFLTIPLQNLAGTAVEAFGQFERATQVLTAAKVPADQIAQILNGLKRDRPLLTTIGDAARFAGQFASVGVEINLALRAVKALEQQTVRTGGGAQELFRVVQGLVQVLGKGVLSAEELNQQIFEAVPSLRPVVQRVFGTANAQALEALGITGKQFVAGITAELEKIGPPILTATQKLEQLKARAADALAPLGDALLRIVVPALEAIVPVIERIANAFAELPRPIQTLIVVFGGLLAVTGPLLTVFGGFIQLFQVFQVAKVLQLAQALQATSVAATATTVSLSTLLPILGLIAGAIAIVTIATRSYQTATDAASKITVESITSQARLLQSYQAALPTVSSLAAQQNLNTAEHNRLQQAIALLDPTTQAYIKTLQNQQEVAAEVNAELQRLADRSVENLKAQETLLTQAIIESSQKAEELKQKIADLSKERQAYTEALEADKNATFDQITATEGAINTTAAYREIQQGAAKAIVDSQTASDENSKALRTQAATLNAVVKALGNSIDAFLAKAEAEGRSKDQIQSLRNALLGFVGDQGTATEAADQATNAIERQALAIGNLKTALEALDFKKVESGLQGQIEEIAKTSKTVAEARQRLQELRRREPTVDQAIERNIQRTKNLKALKDVIDPSTTTRKPQAARPEAGAARLREAIKLGDSLFAISQAQAQAQIALAQSTEQTQTAALRTQLEERTILIDEYFDGVARLQKASSEATVQGIENQLNDIQRRFKDINEEQVKALAQAQANLQKAKDPRARQRAQEDIEDVGQKGQEKLNRLKAEEIELGARLTIERNKAKQDESELAAARARANRDLREAVEDARGQLATLNGEELQALLINQAQRYGDLLRRVVQEFGSASDQARAILRLINVEIENVRRRQLETLQSALQSDLQSSIAQVQQRIDSGLIGETKGRREILELQRQARAELEKALLAQLKIVQSTIQEPSARAAAIAQIKAQVIEVQALGIDPIFKEIKDGLINDLGGTFEDVLRNLDFSLEGLRGTLLSVIDSFKNAIAKKLRELVQEKIVEPLVNVFLQKVLGFNVADTANVTATAANTAAIEALTAAILTAGGQAIAGKIAGGQANFPILFPEGISAPGEATAEEVAGPTGPLGKFFGKIKSAFSSFADGVGNIAGKIGGGLKSVLSSLFSFFGSIFGSLFGGAKAAPTASFAEGGVTPGGPGDVAGVVHGSEYVTPASVTSRWLPFLEGMRRGAIQPSDVLLRGSGDLFGSALRGINSLPYRAIARRGGFAIGGLAANVSEQSLKADKSGDGKAVKLRLINVNDPEMIRDFVNSSEFEQVLINRLSQNPNKFKSALLIQPTG